ncbi:hypothetical protein BKA93DRAFT_831002 [Sparassis latifolia]
MVTHPKVMKIYTGKKRKKPSPKGKFGGTLLQYLYSKCTEWEACDSVKKTDFLLTDNDALVADDPNGLEDPSPEEIAALMDFSELENAEAAHHREVFQKLCLSMGQWYHHHCKKIVTSDSDQKAELTGACAKIMQAFTDLAPGMPHKPQILHAYSREYYRERIQDAYNLEMKRLTYEAIANGGPMPKDVAVRATITKANELTSAMYWLKPLADYLSDKFSMAVSILLAGPIADLNGAIEVRSAHAGQTPGLVNLCWPEFDPIGYADVKASMVHFAECLYPQPECDKRVLWQSRPSSQNLCSGQAEPGPSGQASSSSHVGSSSPVRISSTASVVVNPFGAVIATSSASVSLPVPSAQAESVDVSSNATASFPTPSQPTLTSIPTLVREDGRVHETACARVTHRWRSGDVFSSSATSSPSAAVVPPQPVASDALPSLSAPTSITTAETSISSQPVTGGTHPFVIDLISASATETSVQLSLPSATPLWSQSALHSSNSRSDINSSPSPITPAIPSSTSTARDSDLVATIPVLDLTCFSDHEKKLYENLIRERGWGSEWSRMLTSLVLLEKEAPATVKRLGGNKARLAEVASWMKIARLARDMEIDDSVAFAKGWWGWWTSLQPSTRAVGDDGKLQQDRSAVVWDSLCITGPNGLLLVVVCLAWWGMVVVGKASAD